MDTQPKLPAVRAIGPAIDKLHALRESKRALEEKIKDIESEYGQLEEALLGKLKADGVDKATGKSATVSITSSVTASVVDWDKLHAFIKKTGNTQLYYRRVSDPAYRELLETKGVVPGIQPFTKTKLNLRNL